MLGRPQVSVLEPSYTRVYSRNTKNKGEKMCSPLEEAESCIETGVFHGFPDCLTKLRELGLHDQATQLLEEARATPGYFLTSSVAVEPHGRGGVPQNFM